MIIEEKKEEEAPKPESTDDGEEVKVPESEAEELPELDSDADDTVIKFDPNEQVRQLPWNTAGDFSADSPSELHSGVVVHVSNLHQLAHVRFCNADVQPPVGSMVIVYKVDNEEPVAISLPPFFFPQPCQPPELSSSA